MNVKTLLIDSSIALFFAVMTTNNMADAAMMATTTTTTTTRTASKLKHIVVIGGGIQGTSVAYHLARALSKDTTTTSTTITLLESKAPASAASGKGGGFMARSWGNGSPTQRLHELSFDMYQDLAKELGCESFRTLPVLSVSSSTGYNNNYSKGLDVARKDTTLGPLIPEWLDGEYISQISAMGYGDDTAQVTPMEVVTKMLEATKDRVNVVLGTCTGIETEQQGSESPPVLTNRKVTAVKYTPRDGGGGEEVTLPADAVVISAGPWSCAAEQWFQGAVTLPMEGIKSTSIVWKKPKGQDSVDATALFCGENSRFGTHCKFCFHNVYFPLPLDTNWQSTG